MSKFKIGDKVRLVKNSTASVNCIGVVGIVGEIKTQPDRNIYRIRVEGNPNYGNWSDESDLELVVDIEYEKNWQLNDGSKTIPEDADKLEKNGSVVAYRLRKEEPPKFGDMFVGASGAKFVFICKSAIPSRYFMVKEGETSVSLCNVENYKKVK